MLFATYLNAVQCEGKVAFVIEGKLSKGFGNDVPAHRKVSVHHNDTIIISVDFFHRCTHTQKKNGANSLVTIADDEPNNVNATNNTP